MASEDKQKHHRWLVAAASGVALVLHAQVWLELLGRWGEPMRQRALFGLLLGVAAGARASVGIVRLPHLAGMHIGLGVLSALAPKAANLAASVALGTLHTSAGGEVLPIVWAWPLLTTLLPGVVIGAALVAVARLTLEDHATAPLAFGGGLLAWLAVALVLVPLVGSWSDPLVAAGVAALAALVVWRYCSQFDHEPDPRDPVVSGRALWLLAAAAMSSTVALEGAAGAVVQVAPGLLGAGVFLALLLGSRLAPKLRDFDPRVVAALVCLLAVSIHLLVGVALPILPRCGNAAPWLAAAMLAPCWMGVGVIATLLLKTTAPTVVVLVASGAAGGWCLGIVMLSSLGLEAAFLLPVGLGLVAAVVDKPPLGDKLGSLGVREAAAVLFLAGVVYAIGGKGFPRSMLAGFGEVPRADCDTVHAAWLSSRDKERLRWIDGQRVAADSSVRLAAHLPLLLHRHPRRVLIARLESAQAITATLSHAVDRVDVVAPSRSVRDIIGGVAINNNGRVNVIAVDGTVAAAMSAGRYDVAIVDPGERWWQSRLLTTEALRRFHAAASLVSIRLGATGDDASLQVALRTVMGVFATVEAFRDMATGDLVLIAARKPIVLDLAGVERGFAHSPVHNNLGATGIHNVATLVTLHTMTGAQLKEYAGSGAVNSAARPVLATRRSSGDKARLFTEPNAEAVGESTQLLELYRSYRKGQLAPLTREDFSSVARYVERALGEPHALAKRARDMAARAPRHGAEVASTVFEVEHRRARRHHRANELRLAINAYRDALRLQPEHLAARIDLAIALREARRLDDARAVLDRLVFDRPEMPGPLVELGRVHEDAGRVAQAADAYRRAVAVAPSAPALTYLARLHENNNRLAEAEKLLREALRVDPGYRWALMNLTMLLRKRGDKEAAAQIIDGALKRYPRDVQLEAVKRGTPVLQQHVPVPPNVGVPARWTGTPPKAPGSVQLPQPKDKAPPSASGKAVPN